MAAAFAGRLFLVLSLFHVLIDVAISRSRIDAFEADKKPDDSSQNISASPTTKSSPDYMLQLLQRETNSDGDQVQTGKVRGNIVYGITEKGGLSDRSFKFNVTIKKTEVLKFAELELYKLPSTLDASSNSTVTIQIDDIYNCKRVSSHLVSMETTGWINFTIPLDIIRRWKRNPASNAGLAVNINESNMAPAIRFATRQTHPSLQLLLLLHCINTENRLPDEVLNVPIEATAQQRKPRSVIASHTHTGPCRRRHQIIHFKDLGWDDWVIFPRMYSAYHCAGTCQVPDVKKMKTNHARLQLFLSQQDSDLADAPCCVPDQLGSISMLYYGGPGESTYVLKEMNDFVVKSCGCH